MAIQEDETPEQYVNLKCLEWENTKRNLKSALMVPARNKCLQEALRMHNLFASYFFNPVINWLASKKNVGPILKSIFLNFWRRKSEFECKLFWFIQLNCPSLHMKVKNKRN